eukprot:CAMPEP_0202959830 /NCGR_PEP_ID=MMETSP1396-20130829/4007_1 /ASSEMBLY_ACC=CAM_ASM_000872 /TAXON_ID= /ORGANISM="Pseudokeronopsis sp., Strain Brazil" /LENGTH=73 /DNA_ID=CAMNT_0049678629 /DNA_START=228 /DNA_END=449 /DNA_ORIENTATION=-
MIKDYCPGYFDLVSGGVVGADESDIENAKREIYEEIGAAEVEPRFLCRLKFENEKTKVWGNIYQLQYDGELRP